MSSINQRTLPGSSGFILISILFTTIFVMVAGAATAQLATNNYRASTLEQYRVNAQFAADAGIDSALQSINSDLNWTGSGSEIELFTNSSLKTTYESVVTAGSDDEHKILTVTGRTYAPASSSTPRIERSFKVTLRGITSGDFSVVSGVGGLEMTNNSKILGGNLFVNGSIKMSNSAQIGLSTNPVDVRAAHANCPVPANSSYPQVCGSGENGEPIDIGGSAHIYGEVIATNQTDGSSMSSPGLVSGSVTPSALPSHDRAAQVAAVANNMTGADAGCSSGTKTWPANLKITGNVSISNSCKVTVQGNVWITGNLSISNSADLIVANGLADPPVVIIDGSSGFTATNGAELLGNTSDVGFRIITYWSAAGCSPGCGDVTGLDLYNSRNTTTINLSNSAEGANTEFYARWSKVELSNGGNIGALVGQTVKLSNSAAITFGASVSGIGGITAWVIDSYQREF